MDSLNAATITTPSSHIYISPSPFLLPERLNTMDAEDPEQQEEIFSSLSSTSSSSHHPTITFTPLPSRPSVLTNKMSPYNSIRKPSTETGQESKRILTNLPSVKNERRLAAGRTSSSRGASGTSTPELSRSSSTTSSNTPVLSPESIPESVSSALTYPSDISNSSPYFNSKPLVRKHSIESMMTTSSSSDNSSQYSCLAKDDQYLLHLRDVEGMSCWSDIAEKMCQKGYAVQQRGLRTRYCTLKRDLDLNLQRSMENLSNIQSEVDEMLGSANAPVRRLNSFRNKKMGSNLRVYDEEDEAVDPRVWEALAASFRASGLR